MLAPQLATVRPRVFAPETGEPILLTDAVQQLLDTERILQIVGGPGSGKTTACHGSRTGFYTDEFHAQDYKAPEEIRKANLRGADLRGATIEHTDFYLVDLRDALYDPEQAEHLQQCGAILESRMA